MKEYNKGNDLGYNKAKKINIIGTNIIKKLEIERKLRKLYKNILCSRDLEEIINFIAIEVMNIFSLEKVAIIEEENDNFIFRKYITKEHSENTVVTREIMYEEVLFILKQENRTFYSDEDYDLNKFSMWKRIKVEDGFNIILSIEGKKSVINLDTLRGFLKEILDITRSMYLKEIKYLELKKESYTDGLTKCYNRNYFELKMAELSDQENIGVVVFDLDCLKEINDKLGHDFGDNVLKTLVNIIKYRTDKEDIFCRYGGDEFVVLTTNKDENDVKRMIEKIQDSYNEISIKSFPMNVSIGYSMKIKKEDSIKETFKMADYKMYSKKIENKKNSINKINHYIEEKNMLKYD